MKGEKIIYNFFFVLFSITIYSRLFDVNSSWEELAVLLLNISEKLYFYVFVLNSSSCSSLFFQINVFQWISTFFIKIMDIDFNRHGIQILISWKKSSKLKKKFLKNYYSIKIHSIRVKKCSWFCLLLSIETFSWEKSCLIISAVFVYFSSFA